MSDFEGYPGHGGFYEPNPMAKPVHSTIAESGRSAISDEPEQRNQTPAQAEPTLNALQEAKARFESGAWESAALCAAIAQAEALTRLAEVAETMLEANLLGTADHA